MKRFENALRHALFIVENLVVPESQNPEALRAQIGIASMVARAFRVLPTIRLDDQPFTYAGEVDDIMIDHELAFELESDEPLGPQDLP